VRPSADTTCEARLTFGLAKRSTSGNPLSKAAPNTPTIRKIGVNATIQSNRALPKKLLDVFFAMVFY
jgi:hypothetical protein